MATDRGRRRPGRGRGTATAPSAVRNGVHLAAGVRLVRADDEKTPVVLVCGDGNVQLNDGAVAILSLCDGSRGREEIIAQIAQHSQGSALAADIRAFLDAASSRGWIVDPGAAMRDQQA